MAFSILKKKHSYEPSDKAIRIQSELETTVLISDSFGVRIERLLQDQREPFGEEFIIGAPGHRIGHGEQSFKLYTICRGGRKLEEGLQDSEIRNIIIKRAKVILVMLGMCDIASLKKMDWDNKWFYNQIIQFQQQIRSVGERIAKTEEEREFVMNIPINFATLQNWGIEYTPHSGCVTPKECCEMRSRNVKYAKQNLASLHNDHNLLLLDLNIPNPTRERDNMHYDQNTTEKLWERVKKIFMRHLCSRCVHLSGGPIPRIATRIQIAEYLRQIKEEPLCVPDVQ